MDALHLTVIVLRFGWIVVKTMHTLGAQVADLARDIEAVLDKLEALRAFIAAHGDQISKTSQQRLRRACRDCHKTLQQAERLCEKLASTIGGTMRLVWQPHAVEKLRQRLRDHREVLISIQMDIAMLLDAQNNRKLNALTDGQKQPATSKKPAPSKKPAASKKLATSEKVTPSEKPATSKKVTPSKKVGTSKKPIMPKKPVASKKPVTSVPISHKSLSAQARTQPRQVGPVRMIAGSQVTLHTVTLESRTIKTTETATIMASSHVARASEEAVTTYLKPQQSSKALPPLVPKTALQQKSNSKAKGS